MNEYQKLLFHMFAPWRPKPSYATYPPYHSGPYLEDYFFDRFSAEEPTVQRYFIPVSWTTCYVEGKTNRLQEALLRLDQNHKYFTIAQHDDAIREKLPSDTIMFNAGGNGGGVPIPLICSPLPKPPPMNRDIFCSFVGSMTHHLRQSIYNTLHQNDKYYFFCKQWTESIPQHELSHFQTITSRSVFALAPRGYGRSSFRLYEAMQLGAIPVYVFDAKWCPFENELDWSKFCVLIDADKIGEIDTILSDYSPERIKEMQDNLLPIWKDNFTMDAVYSKVLNSI